MLLASAAVQAKVDLIAAFSGTGEIIATDAPNRRSWIKKNGTWLQTGVGEVVSGGIDATTAVHCGSADGRIRAFFTGAANDGAGLQLRGYKFGDSIRLTHGYNSSTDATTINLRVPLESVPIVVIPGKITQVDVVMDDFNIRVLINGSSNAVINTNTLYNRFIPYHGMYAATATARWNQWQYLTA